MKNIILVITLFITSLAYSQNDECTASFAGVQYSENMKVPLDTARKTRVLTTSCDCKVIQFKLALIDKGRDPIVQMCYGPILGKAAQRMSAMKSGATLWFTEIRVKCEDEDASRLLKPLALEVE